MIIIIIHSLSFSYKVPEYDSGKDCVSADEVRIYNTSWPVCLCLEYYSVKTSHFYTFFFFFRGISGTNPLFSYDGDEGEPQRNCVPQIRTITM